MNCSVFRVYGNTYFEKVFEELFVVLLFAILVSKLATEIFLHVKQGTESKVFDVNLKLQPFELNKASGCLSQNHL